MRVGGLPLHRSAEMIGLHLFVCESNRLGSDKIQADLVGRAKVYRCRLWQATLTELVPHKIKIGERVLGAGGRVHFGLPPALGLTRCGVGLQIEGSLLIRLFSAMVDGLIELGRAEIARRGRREPVGDGEAGNRGIQFKAETQGPFGPSSVQAALAQSQTTGPVDGVTQLLIWNRRSTGAPGG